MEAELCTWWFDISEEGEDASLARRGEWLSGIVEYIGTLKLQ